MTAQPTGAATSVVTVLGATGGCGKTTVATTLAVVLAGTGTDRVCLVDLDADGDGVATAFAARRGPGTAPVPVAPGLDAVLAEVAPGRRTAPGAVSELVARLSTRYQHVVVDTPAAVTATSVAALDYSTAHVVVAAAERRSARALRGLLDALDLLGFRADRRAVVVNRCDDRVGYPATALAADARTAVGLALPFDWAVAAAGNRGAPLAVGQPHHPFPAAVRRFAAARSVPPDLCGRDPP